mmetsp:Transcript_28271/g.64328  ORF Transcript_28271/g.64328 Transcript_28271/m.64328 type:complete len:240 (-) Transcript_28271:921-1640(-)
MQCQPLAEDAFDVGWFESRRVGSILESLLMVAQFEEARAPIRENHVSWVQRLQVRIRLATLQLFVNVWLIGKVCRTVQCQCVEQHGLSIFSRGKGLVALSLLLVNARDNSIDVTLRPRREDFFNWLIVGAAVFYCLDLVAIWRFHFDDIFQSFIKRLLDLVLLPFENIKLSLRHGPRALLQALCFALSEHSFCRELPVQNAGHKLTFLCGGVPSCLCAILHVVGSRFKFKNSVAKCSHT